VWRGGEEIGPGCRYLNKKLDLFYKAVTKNTAEPEYQNLN